MSRAKAARAIKPVETDLPPPGAAAHLGCWAANHLPCGLTHIQWQENLKEV